MLSTSATTIATARAARLATPPTGPAAGVPGRRALLEPFRQRNLDLDGFFYNVGKVRPAEAALIAPDLAAEGAILLVPPSSDPALLTLCRDIAGFHTAGGAAAVALVVAGVGSSALGSAAFARDVADALGAPVAAVVSGYGLSDLMTEALGGFFLFGTLNRMRHGFEMLDQGLAASGTAPSGFAGGVTGGAAARSQDTQAVAKLLADQRFDFKLLAGHSKGNLVLSEALYALDKPAREALAKRTKIATVSARIAMPAPFRVLDIIGRWDPLGAMNSRIDIPAEIVVDFAMHHTNTERLWHLPVETVLRDGLANWAHWPV